MIAKYGMKCTKSCKLVALYHIVSYHIKSSCSVVSYLITPCVDKLLYQIVFVISNVFLVCNAHVLSAFISIYLISISLYCIIVVPHFFLVYRSEFKSTQNHQSQSLGVLSTLKVEHHHFISPCLTG